MMSKGKQLKHLLIPICIFVLSACGGGGDDSNTTTTANTSTGIEATNSSAPVFSSANTASAPESQLDANYKAVATDADGDTLSYKINGGIDAAAFSINEVSGKLIFNSAPNFEVKASYAVTLAADDNRGRVTTHDVVVTITDVV